MGFFNKSQDIRKNRGVILVGTKDEGSLNADAMVMEAIDGIPVFRGPID